MHYAKTVAIVKQNPEIVAEHFGLPLGDWERTNYGYGTFTPLNKKYSGVHIAVIRKIQFEDGGKFTIVVTGPYLNELVLFKNWEEFLVSPTAKKIANPPISIYLTVKEANISADFLESIGWAECDENQPFEFELYPDGKVLVGFWDREPNYASVLRVREIVKNLDL